MRGTHIYTSTAPPTLHAKPNTNTEKHTSDTRTKNSSSSPRTIALWGPTPTQSLTEGHWTPSFLGVRLPAIQSGCNWGDRPQCPWVQRICLAGISTQSRTRHTFTGAPLDRPSRSEQLLDRLGHGPEAHMNTHTPLYEWARKPGAVHPWSEDCLSTKGSGAKQQPPACRWSLTLVTPLTFNAESSSLHELLQWECFATEEVYRHYPSYHLF